MFARIALIYNPHSGRPRQRQAAIDRFVAALRGGGGPELEILPTQRPHHATELARAAVGRGCDLVIAHGGDGTMNEALQAVAGTGAVLGFWPGGTANVMAVEVGLPREPEAFARRVVAGRTQTVTVGKANERYFLLMAGIGLDAAVAAGVAPGLKRRIGKGAFGVAALPILWRWEMPELLIDADGERLSGRFVVAGNARSYGGGFQLTPRADLAAPHLDLMIVTARSRFTFAWVALAAMFGRHLILPAVQYRQVRQAVVHAAGGASVPLQLDGEVTGGLPVTLEALPGHVRILT